MGIEHTFPSAAQFDKMNEQLVGINNKIGVAATVDIVETKTLEAGEQATVEETEQSTPSNRKYVLGVPKGGNGENGFSPTISTEETLTGIKVTITAKDGPHVFEVRDGQDGEPGGDGESAGFGTVKATANQLEAGQQPTVQAEASGPDTAKNITFTFGIPKGRDGLNGDDGDPGAAAGFGTISATASKLPAGSEPTAEVSATGPDTAKNLAFTFGIPEGQKGPAYELTPEDKSSIVQAVLAALPNAEGVGF